MKKFKIRCSTIGQIMTNPRKKGETLSKTTKNYCKTWVKEQLSGVKKEFKSKYTEKGNRKELEAIEYLQNNANMPLLLKNERLFEDEYKRGTPDIILSDKIIDIKTSWNFFTFPLFCTENLKKEYDWQVQGYMDLTGKEKAIIAYLLVNTPKILIEKEIYYATKDYEFLTKEQYEEIENYIIKKYTFDHLSKDLRIKMFEVKRDYKKIRAINKRVEECRKYIDILIYNYLNDI